MQSSASRRALSALVSKLHPQVPLTARESQQLLNLLTTSFRAHLDREHPVPAPEHSQTKRSPQALTKTNKHHDLSIRHDSSYSSAHHHIDSILTNPLFAVRPRRRGSEPAAVDVLKNPEAWFREQIAIGAADFAKAVMCLEMLQKSGNVHDQRKPGTMIAEWLRTSGLEASAEFINSPSSQKMGTKLLLKRLIRLLVAEGAETHLWRWFTHPPKKRIQETGLDASIISNFRKEILKILASTQANHRPDEAIRSFLRAFEMKESHEYGVTHKELRPLGGVLVSRIMTSPQLSITPELYDAFLHSTNSWLGKWSMAVRSMLWVHHPTKSTALPGLDYIRDPDGALFFVNQEGFRTKKRFIVHLCLDVARKLVEEGKYVDAQIPMNFVKDHFAEMVLAQNREPDSSSTPVRQKQHKGQHNEQQNLELLDQLIPT